MPSIIGNSTLDGRNSGKTGPTGSTGPVGITGNRGASGLTAGATGATGIYIIDAVSDLENDNISFSLSDGSTLGSFFDFKGPTAAYSDSRGVCYATGSAFYSLFYRVDGGKTFEFRGICGGGNIAVSMSPDGYEVLLTVSPLLYATNRGDTASNYVLYTNDQYSVTASRIGVTGSNSILSFGLTAHDGATGSFVKVYSDFTEDSYSIGSIARGVDPLTITTNKVITAVEPYGGYVLDLDTFSVLKLTAPVGITAFTTSADSNVLQSYTLFVNGSDVWNFPKNVYFENTDKGIGEYGFLNGMNILHMWSTNGGATFNAAFVDRAMGAASGFYNSSVGSCCITGLPCVEYTSAENCSYQGGSFFPLKSCAESCGTFVNCCIDEVCYPNTPFAFCGGVGGTAVPECTPGACPQRRGTCCDTENCTENVKESSCVGGKTWTLNGSCTDDALPCTPVYGCCQNPAMCHSINGGIRSACDALGSGYVFSPNATCTDITCNTGACCVTDTTNGSVTCHDTETQTQCNLHADATHNIMWHNGNVCASGPCAGAPDPFGACCSGTTCVDKLKSQCKSPDIFHETKTCSDGTPPCIIGGGYSFTLHETDGTPINNIILASGGSGSYSKTFVLKITRPSNGAGVETLKLLSWINIPGTDKNITITYPQNPINIVSGENNTQITMTVPFEPSGSLDGLETNVPFHIENSAQESVFNGYFLTYVANLPPPDAFGCLSCPGGDSTSIQLQSTFVINRHCLDCNFPVGQNNTYPVLKQQDGLVNYCISQESGCSSLQITCVSFGRIKDVWNCGMSFRHPQQICTHPEYGDGVWEENRTTCQCQPNGITYDYKREIEDLYPSCTSGCAASCKGDIKTIINCSEATTFDPYYSEIVFDTDRQTLYKAGKTDLDIDVLEDNLETTILAMVDNTDGKKMSFNPAKVGFKKNLAASEIPCCVGYNLFDDTRTDTIFDLGWTETGKTVKFLLFLSVSSKPTYSVPSVGLQKTDKSPTQQLPCCGTCNTSVPLVEFLEYYRLGVARVVFDGGTIINTTLSCAPNMFSPADTIKLRTRHFLERRICGGSFVGCCETGGGGMIYPSESWCPHRRVNLLGELTINDLVLVGGKYKIQYWARTATDDLGWFGNTPQQFGPWETGTTTNYWFEGHAYYDKKPKYTQLANREHVETMYMKYLYRLTHCTPGSNKSCVSAGDDCYFNAQHDAYNECLCDVQEGVRPLSLSTDSYLSMEVKPKNGVSVNDPDELEYRISHKMCTVNGCVGGVGTNLHISLGQSNRFNRFDPDDTKIISPTLDSNGDYSISKPFQWGATTCGQGGELPGCVDDQNNEPYVEIFEVNPIAWIESTEANMQGCPIVVSNPTNVFVEHDDSPRGMRLNALSTNPYGVSQSANSSTGEVDMTFAMGWASDFGIDQIGGNGVIGEFVVEAWLVNNYFNKAIKKDISIYADNMTFSWGYDLGEKTELQSNSDWLHPSGGGNVYKAVIRVEYLLFLSSWTNGIKTWRRGVHIFEVNVKDDPAGGMPPPLSALKSKILDGNCVSLDCSQVEILCNSLPDC